MELFSELGDIVIRSGPKRAKTEEVEQNVAGNGRATKLKQDALAAGPDYVAAVADYLKIFTEYQIAEKPREIVTDLEKILTGITKAKSLTEDDIRAIRIRDYSYGSWDNMLTDLEEKSKTRQLYKMVLNNPASKEQEKRISELKDFEQKYNINLADYCLVL